MDQFTSAHGECEVDLESGLVANERDLSQEIVVSSGTETSGVGGCNGSLNCEAKVCLSAGSACGDIREDDVVDAVLGKKVVKKKAKAMSAKKPPKPPRPPRGLSLDSADQKLIKELAEIAKLKRARIERLKALKKMKDAKAASSKNQLLATIFTVVFCLLLLFQGISSRSSSAARSHVPSEAAGGGLFSTQYYSNLSVYGHTSGSESPSSSTARQG